MNQWNNITLHSSQAGEAICNASYHSAKVYMQASFVETISIFVVVLWISVSPDYIDAFICHKHCVKRQYTNVLDDNLLITYECQVISESPGHSVYYSWWRLQMETFSVLLALCAGNSPVTGEFPTQRPVTRSFDVFFDLRLNKRLSKQSWGLWSETPWWSLWRHPNAMHVHCMPDLIKLCVFLFIKWVYTHLCPTKDSIRDSPINA